jgi:succinyl-CoA synthetase beta subunit
MVNGAGLAMATMDAIQLAGGFPANFLDVGGGATKEQVSAAFKLILGDPKVRGAGEHLRRHRQVRRDRRRDPRRRAEVHLAVPLVAPRGTNVDLGRKMLDQSGMKIVTAKTIDEAATQVVTLSKGGGKR